MTATRTPPIETLTRSKVSYRLTPNAEGRVDVVAYVDGQGQLTVSNAPLHSVMAMLDTYRQDGWALEEMQS